MTKIDFSSIENMKDLKKMVSRENLRNLKYRVTLYDINESDKVTNRLTNDKKTEYIFGNMLISNSDLENVDIEIFKDKASLNHLSEGARIYKVSYDVYKSYTHEERIMKILDVWNCYFSS